MYLEYLIANLLAYMLYPIIALNLINVLNEDKSIKDTFKGFVGCNIMFLCSFMNDNTNLFVNIIEIITPFMIIAHLIVYLIVFIKFIINKIRK